MCSASPPGHPFLPAQSERGLHPCGLRIPRSRAVAAVVVPSLLEVFLAVGTQLNSREDPRRKALVISDRRAPKESRSPDPLVRRYSVRLSKLASHQAQSSIPEIEVYAKQRSRFIYRPGGGSVPLSICRSSPALFLTFFFLFLSNRHWIKYLSAPLPPFLFEYSPDSSCESRAPSRSLEVSRYTLARYVCAVSLHLKIEAHLLLLSLRRGPKAPRNLFSPASGSHNKLSKPPSAPPPHSPPATLHPPFVLPSCSPASVRIAARTSIFAKVKPLGVARST